MIKYLLPILFLVGCASAPAPVALKAKSEPDRIVRFQPDKSYRALELIRLEEAEEKVTETLRSMCFRGFITHRKMIQTKGKTNHQVLEHILSQRLDIPLTMYYKNNNVIGYRQPPSKRVFTNRKVHGTAKICGIAGNLAHESAHVMGYGHDYQRTKRRDFSVPYSVSWGFRKCCRE